MEVSVKESGVRPSYAKVNLHLHIGKRRPDGFHDLFSLFHLIDLHDDISVRVTGDGRGELDIEGMPSIPPRENLMGRAAIQFLSAVDASSDSVSLRITKRIPLQGGLGGGSSNAATVLLTLNELYGYPLGKERLADIALSLGSDIPFFIHQCCAAVVEGRGEVIHPIPPRSDLKGLLVIPRGKGISTADAFRSFDALPFSDLNNKRLYDYSKLCHMYDSPVITWDFLNDFRSVVQDYDDIYKELYAITEKECDIHGAVSGSGAAFIFTSERVILFQNLIKSSQIDKTQVINYPVKYLNNISPHGTLDTEYI